LAAVGLLTLLPTGAVLCSDGPMRGWAILPGGRIRS
jgi:hypothetical protein